MTDRSERFFVWVWRINGLIVLVLVGLGAAGLIALAAGAFSGPEEPLREVAGTELTDEDLQLSNFSSIAGSSFLYAQLAESWEIMGSGSISSGGYGSAHNLLFFDAATKQAHWLLPTHEREIASYSFLMDPPRRRWQGDDAEAAEPEQVAMGLLLELEESGGEGTARRSLQLASPDGRSLVPLATGTQGMRGYHHLRKDSLLVFYVSGGAARVLEVDPVARTVRSDALLETGN